MNKQSLHAGVVAGPDGDVLVTYRGDQIQNTPAVLEFWPPQEKTIKENNIVEHTFPHKTFWQMMMRMMIRKKIKKVEKVEKIDC